MIKNGLSPKKNIYNLDQGCDSRIFQYIKLILVEQRGFYKGQYESLVFTRLIDTTEYAKKEEV